MWVLGMGGTGENWIDTKLINGIRIVEHMTNFTAFFWPKSLKRKP